ncbi:hypothetical protein CRG98_003111 [Punica granatum]|uniref:Uncharacterized protein n=1 Tax=Punica granatum TaxID=22663 RepID=A0A2I0L778_PUNGR|nr:hypothetical protein CRG98_003111 [Punica granatum]
MEVAESPYWLPRAIDGLLSSTQVVSRVFTFFASHESFLSVFFCFPFSFVDLLRFELEPIGYVLHGVQRPKPPNTGSNTPHTLNARNPSAEWDLTSSHHYAQSTAYVEGDLDRVCESWLDITRELDRSNGYSENQSILLSPVGPIGPNPRLFEPALL